MIIQIFIQTIMNFLSIIFNFIGQNSPEVNIGTNLSSRIAEILAISQQAINFMHFIIGDTLAIIIPLSLAILTYKYLILPVIDVLRRLIPFVNL